MIGNVCGILVIIGLSIACILQFYENLKLTAKAEVEEAFDKKLKNIIQISERPCLKIEIKGNWEEVKPGTYTHSMNANNDVLTGLEDEVNG